MKSNISVIIPTHNRPQLLKRAIQSVADQTIAPFEIIVVDDADCKTTQDLMRSLKAENIHYIKNRYGKGPASSRNLGVSYAKGDFIAFLDDDDEFKEDKLEIVLTFIRQNPQIDVIYHPAHIQMANERLTYFTKPSSALHPQELFGQLLRKNTVGGTPMVIVKRSSFEEIGGFDESLDALEDYELWLRFAKKRCNFLYIDRPLTNCYYYTRKNSVSKNTNANNRALEIIKDKYSEDFSKLAPKDLKEFKAWQASMAVHKALLNGQVGEAIKTQFSLFLFKPSFTNFILLTVIPLGPKVVFKLKARFG